MLGCHPQTLNLTIHCLDRPGLLAEIAQIIASYGHNIKVCLWAMYMALKCLDM